MKKDEGIPKDMECYPLLAPYLKVTWYCKGPQMARTTLKRIKWNDSLLDSKLSGHCVALQMAQCIRLRDLKHHSVVGWLLTKPRTFNGLFKLGVELLGRTCERIKLDSHFIEYQKLTEN